MQDVTGSPGLSPAEAVRGLRDRLAAAAGEAVAGVLRTVLDDAEGRYRPSQSPVYRDREGPLGRPVSCAIRGSALAGARSSFPKTSYTSTSGGGSSDRYMLSQPPRLRLATDVSRRSSCTSAFQLLERRP